VGFSGVVPGARLFEAKMMKKSETIGHGSNTAKKQVSLKSFSDFYAGILENIRRRNSGRGWVTENVIYDIYAGKGECPSGENGSAVTFSAMAGRLRARAYFCEENQRNAESLQSAMAGNPLVSVTPGRWQECNLPVPSKNHYGICYIDPNGLAQDVDLLNQKMACRTSRVDILFRVGATWYKRCGRSILEITKAIEKSHWIWCPIETDHPRSRMFQDMFLLGSNWVDLPDWKAKGWRRVTSFDDEFWRRAMTRKQLEGGTDELFQL